MGQRRYVMLVACGGRKRKRREMPAFKAVSTRALQSAKYAISFFLGFKVWFAISAPNIYRRQIGITGYDPFPSSVTFLFLYKL